MALRHIIAIIIYYTYLNLLSIYYLLYIIENQHIRKIIICNFEQLYAKTLEIVFVFFHLANLKGNFTIVLHLPKDKLSKHLGNFCAVCIFMW